jgi:3-dehydroquinate synthase
LITVNLGSRSYPIVIGAGVLREVGARLRALGAGAKVALVSDPKVLALHGGPVAGSLKAESFEVSIIELPEGEAAKTLATAESAWERCLEAGLDRGSTLLALGGGAVGDLTGFVAATYMRGIAFVQLPTTLLAQVDASIGGKVAIDHPKAKNLIGAFYQPRLVVIDPETLLTLPDRDYRSGLAEVIKHGIILDADYFADLEAHVGEILSRDLPTLERIVTGSCRLKAGVVEADEREAGLRSILNYGHTVGHAIEALTGYERWAHGEAVSLGIIVAAALAQRLSIATAETRERQIALLERASLPVTFKEPEPQAILEALGRDKKARDGRVPFVLAPRIGEARLFFDIPAADVLAAISEVQATG